MDWKFFIVSIIIAVIFDRMLLRKINMKKFINHNKLTGVFGRIIILIILLFISMASTSLIHHKWDMNEVLRYIVVGILLGIFTRLMDVLFNRA